MRKNRNGFSFAELVVVLAVIAAIAAFVYPRWASARRGADEDAARATANSLLAAISAYYMVNECYPRDVGPDQMPRGLEPYVGGQWPRGFDYEEWAWVPGIGVSWRPGGQYRWTAWLVHGTPYRVCQ